MIITEVWIYRVFYGAIIFPLSFAITWETIKTGKVPAVPISTVIMIAILTGGEAAIAFLKKA